MNRKRWLGVIGAVGVAAAMTGCGEDKELRKFVAPGGKLDTWHKKVEAAVCQLELKDTSGLDPNMRICTNGPGDKGPPPTYP
jgi:hypothetical protein